MGDAVYSGATCPVDLSQVEVFGSSITVALEITETKQDVKVSAVLAGIDSDVNEVRIWDGETIYATWPLALGASALDLDFELELGSYLLEIKAGTQAGTPMTGVSFADVAGTHDNFLVAKPRLRVDGQLAPFVTTDLPEWPSSVTEECETDPTWGF